MSEKKTITEVSFNAVNSDENPVAESDPVRTAVTLPLYVVAAGCVLCAFLMAVNVSFQHDNHTVLAVVVLLILGDRVVKIIDYVTRSSPKRVLARGTTYWLLCLLVLSFAAM